jgi:hypothetical protein
LKNHLYNNIMKDQFMAREFRIAMLHLCKCILYPEALGPLSPDMIIKWLTGSFRSIAPLAKALIYQKINRNNARHMLFSLAHWVRLVGSQGIVITLDIRRVTEELPKSLRDDGVYYSKYSTMDTYEVLRQFIDSSDELENGLIIVIASKEFEFTSRTKRSIDLYPPLKLRIIDDVRDKRRANPLGPLVRVASVTEEK